MMSSKRRSQDESNLSQSQLLPPRPKQPTQPSTSSTPTSPHLPFPSNTSPVPHDSPASSPSTPSDTEPPPGQDLPLSMSTSLLLTSPNLPTDARTALTQLSSTLDPPSLKVAIRFHAIGSAPQLKQKVFKISASSKFGTVVAFLRKKLYGKPAEGEGQEDGKAKGGGGAGQGLFCYVNSVFAPGLDEGVGNLWRCFKTDDQLIVGYSITPAFG